MPTSRNSPKPPALYGPRLPLPVLSYTRPFMAKTALLLRIVSLPCPTAPMRPGRRGNLHALVMRDMDELSEVPRHAIRQRARHPIGKRATRHSIIKEKTGLTPRRTSRRRQWRNPSVHRQNHVPHLRIDLLFPFAAGKHAIMAHTRLQMVTLHVRAKARAKAMRR